MKTVRRMTNSECKAMDGEIRSQIAGHMNAFSEHLSATLLCYMHFHHGHGKKRLEADLVEFKKWLDELKAFYEMDNGDDITYVCIKILKELGFDTSKLIGIYDVEYSINGRKGKDAKWSRR